MAANQNLKADSENLDFDLEAFFPNFSTFESPKEDMEKMKNTELFTNFTNFSKNSAWTCFATVEGFSFNLQYEYDGRTFEGKYASHNILKPTATKVTFDCPENSPKMNIKNQEAEYNLKTVDHLQIFLNVYKPRAIAYAHAIDQSINLRHNLFGLYDSLVDWKTQMEDSYIREILKGNEEQLRKNIGNDFILTLKCQVDNAVCRLPCLTNGIGPLAFCDTVAVECESDRATFRTQVIVDPVRISFGRNLNFTNMAGNIRDSDNFLSSDEFLKLDTISIRMYGLNNKHTEYAWLQELLFGKLTFNLSVENLQTLSNFLEHFVMMFSRQEFSFKNRLKDKPNIKPINLPAQALQHRKLKSKMPDGRYVRSFDFSYEKTLLIVGGLDGKIIPTSGQHFTKETEYFRQPFLEIKTFEPIKLSGSGLRRDIMKNKIHLRIPQIGIYFYDSPSNCLDHTMKQMMKNLSKRTRSDQKASKNQKFQKNMSSQIFSPEKEGTSKNAIFSGKNFIQVGVIYKEASILEITFNEETTEMISDYHFQINHLMYDQINFLRYHDKSRRAIKFIWDNENAKNIPDIFRWGISFYKGSAEAKSTKHLSLERNFYSFVDEYAKGTLGLSLFDSNQLMTDQNNVKTAQDLLEQLIQTSENDRIQAAEKLKKITEAENEKDEGHLRGGHGLENQKVIKFVRPNTRMTNNTTLTMGARSEIETVITNGDTIQSRSEVDEILDDVNNELEDLEEEQEIVNENDDDIEDGQELDSIADTSSEFLDSDLEDDSIDEFLSATDNSDFQDNLDIFDQETENFESPANNVAEHQIVQISQQNSNTTTEGTNTEIDGLFNNKPKKARPNFLNLGLKKDKPSVSPRKRSSVQVKNQRKISKSDSKRKISEISNKKLHDGSKDLSNRILRSRSGSKIHRNNNQNNENLQNSNKNDPLKIVQENIAKFYQNHLLMKSSKHETTTIESWKSSSVYGPWLYSEVRSSWNKKYQSQKLNAWGESQENVNKDNDGKLNNNNNQDYQIQPKTLFSITLKNIDISVSPLIYGISSKFIKASINCLKNCDLLAVLNSYRNAAISSALKPLEKQIGLTSISFSVDSIAVTNIQYSPGSNRLFYLKNSNENPVSGPAATSGGNHQNHTYRNRIRQTSGQHHQSKRDVPLGVSVYAGIKNLTVSLNIGQQTRDNMASELALGTDVTDIMVRNSNFNDAIRDMKILEALHNELPKSMIRKSIPVSLKLSLRSFNTQLRCLSIDGMTPVKPYIVAIPERLVNNRLSYQFDENKKGWSAVTAEVNLDEITFSGIFSMQLTDIEDGESNNKRKKDSDHSEKLTSFNQEEEEERFLLIDIENERPLDVEKGFNEIDASKNITVTTNLEENGPLLHDHRDETSFPNYANVLPDGSTRKNHENISFAGSDSDTLDTDNNNDAFASSSFPVNQSKFRSFCTSAKLELENFSINLPAPTKLQTSRPIWSFISVSMSLYQNWLDIYQKMDPDLNHFILLNKIKSTTALNILNLIYKGRQLQAVTPENGHHGNVFSWNYFVNQNELLPNINILDQLPEKFVKTLSDHSNHLLKDEALILIDNLIRIYCLESFRNIGNKIFRDVCNMAVENAGSSTSFLRELEKSLILLVSYRKDKELFDFNETYRNFRVILGCIEKPTLDGITTSSQTLKNILKKVGGSAKFDILLKRFNVNLKQYTKIKVSPGKFHSKLAIIPVINICDLKLSIHSFLQGEFSTKNSQNQNKADRSNFQDYQRFSLGLTTESQSTVRATRKNNGSNYSNIVQIDPTISIKQIQISVNMNLFRLVAQIQLMVSTISYAKNKQDRQDFRRNRLANMTSGKYSSQSSHVGNYGDGFSTFRSYKSINQSQNFNITMSHSRNSSEPSQETLKFKQMIHSTSTAFHKLELNKQDSFNRGLNQKSSKNYDDILRKYNIERKPGCIERCEEIPCACDLERLEEVARKKNKSLDDIIYLAAKQNELRANNNHNKNLASGSMANSQNSNYETSNIILQARVDVDLISLSGSAGSLSINCEMSNWTNHFIYKQKVLTFLKSYRPTLSSTSFKADVKHLDIEIIEQLSQNFENTNDNKNNHDQQNLPVKKIIIQAICPFKHSKCKTNNEKFRSPNTTFNDAMKIQIITRSYGPQDNTFKFRGGLIKLEVPQRGTEVVSLINNPENIKVFDEFSHYMSRPVEFDQNLDEENFQGEQQHLNNFEIDHENFQKKVNLPEINLMHYSQSSGYHVTNQDEKEGMMVESTGYSDNLNMAENKDNHRRSSSRLSIPGNPPNSNPQGSITTGSQSGHGTYRGSTFNHQTSGSTQNNFNLVRKKLFKIDCLFDGLDFRAGFIPLLISTYKVSEVNWKGNFGQKMDFTGIIKSHNLKFEHDSLNNNAHSSTKKYPNQRAHHHSHYNNKRRFSNGRSRSYRYNDENLTKNGKIQTKPAEIALPTIEIRVKDKMKIITKGNPSNNIPSSSTVQENLENVHYQNGEPQNFRKNSISNDDDEEEETHYFFVDIKINKFVKTLDNHIINQMIFGFEAVMFEIKGLQKKLVFEGNTLGNMHHQKQESRIDHHENIENITITNPNTNTGITSQSVNSHSNNNNNLDKKFHVSVEFQEITITASTESSNAVQFSIPGGIDLQITNIEALKRVLMNSQHEKNAYFQNIMPDTFTRNTSQQDFGQEFRPSERKLQHQLSNLSNDQKLFMNLKSHQNFNNSNNGYDNYTKDYQQIEKDQSLFQQTNEIYAQSHFSLKLAVGLVNSEDQLVKELGKFMTNLNLNSQMDATAMKDSKFTLDINTPTVTIYPSALDLCIRFYLSYKSSYEAWTNQRTMSMDEQNILSNNNNENGANQNFKIRMTKSTSKEDPAFNIKNGHRSHTSSTSHVPYQNNNYDSKNNLKQNNNRLVKKLEFAININNFQVNLPLVSRFVRENCSQSAKHKSGNRVRSRFNDNNNNGYSEHQQQNKVTTLILAVNSAKTKLIMEKKFHLDVKFQDFSLCFESQTSDAISKKMNLKNCLQKEQSIHSENSRSRIQTFSSELMTRDESHKGGVQKNNNYSNSNNQCTVPHGSLELDSQTDISNDLQVNGHIWKLVCDCKMSGLEIDLDQEIALHFIDFIATMRLDYPSDGSYQIYGLDLLSDSQKFDNSFHNNSHYLHDGNNIILSDADEEEYQNMTQKDLEYSTAEQVEAIKALKDIRDNPPDQLKGLVDEMRELENLIKEEEMKLKKMEYYLRTKFMKDRKTKLMTRKLTARRNEMSGIGLGWKLCVHWH